MIEPRAAKKSKPPNARQLLNEWNVKVYAGVVAGVIAALIIYHWAQWIRRKTSKSTRTGSSSPLAKASRKIRSLLVRKVPGFPTGGHALLTIAFIGVNIVMSFHHVDKEKMSNFAARFGWMSTANMALCVFFGLKNTLLGVLTGHSYERLNFFHRRQNRWSTLLEVQNWEGIGAGLAMLLLLMGLARNFGYEWFYVSHMVGFLLAIIFTGLHRPYWIWKIPVAMVFIAAIWGLDRLIRGSRMLYNLVNNSATIYRLPDNGVRLVIKKPLSGATPGSHCFVWIPGVRPFQTHPFTIVSNTPHGGLELVLSSYDGFTKALHDRANTEAGTTVWASVDGPYGAFSNPKKHDKVVLIAGGSGATFTFGLATNLLQHLESESHKRVDFIWAVRKRENLEWFTDHLQSLSQHGAGVNVLFHITREGSVASLSELSELNVSSPTSLKSPKEKVEALLPEPGTEQSKETLPSTVAVPQGDRSLGLEGLCDIKFDKLRAGEAITQTLQSAAPGQRVLIAACGPQSLTEIVQNAAAHCIASGEISIEVHCENFGW
ncbi:ferric reductase NAD binding domain-containing protein [Colletotrichum phormii]|uniref:ferric-chelate reductase (NADPH) n=1 Tax=Colletotrichum phormii TaxID=359342 RepID=A0AAI9ZJP6_9PEZI|nr:ferric reductase NAD binding domain-containing protein [Colletotrichum phormii]KAK1625522.1 ferric reductase NAD binding domain-containing protein [Colletotrichum phormii]